ncbi:MAG: type II toxin-antitoxin system HicB family antitoxin [Planctomycetes bacterium]|nr:type II toxin-antitoxin system HicB family antitoxin [Planctomycetota bacterium]
MQISVLVEPIENDGYRATVMAPPLMAEAPTREEALNRLRELIRGKFSNAEVVRIDIDVTIPGEAHPWKSIAGTWKDHPDAADFEQNIRDYRRSVNSDRGRP